MAIHNPFRRASKDHENRASPKRRHSLVSRGSSSTPGKYGPSPTSPRSSLSSIRQKMSAGTKRVRIAKMIDKLEAESQDLDSEWTKLYDDLRCAKSEHDHLSQSLQDIVDVEKRQAENQFAQETLLEWLRRMLVLGKRPRLKHTPNAQGRRRKDRLRRTIGRVKLRRDHLQTRVALVARLMHWIQNELQIQRMEHMTAESDEEGLDSDKFLPDVLEERMMRRQILRKKREGEGHLPTTVEDSNEFFGNMGEERPGWMPSSEVFDSNQPDHLHYVQEHVPPTDNEWFERPQPVEGGPGECAWRHSPDRTPLNLDKTGQPPVTEMNVPGRKSTDIPAINITTSTPSDSTAAPLETRFRRLSVDELPALPLPQHPKQPFPLPCKHNQWMPRSDRELTCHNCMASTAGRTYYCPKCPAEICSLCFLAKEGR